MKLHPMFAAYWAVWSVGMVVACWGDVMWTKWLLLAFLPVEAWGALRKGTLGDTLSEFIQSFGYRGKDMHWYRGWKMVPAGFSIFVAWRAAYALGHPFDSPSRFVNAAIIGLMCAGWLFYHWTRPSKYDAGAT